MYAQGFRWCGSRVGPPKSEGGDAPSERMVRLRMRRILLPLSCLLLLPPILFAQRATTTVTGTVTDPSGAAVPDAQILVQESSTGTASRAQSNAAGAYVISNL